MVEPDLDWRLARRKRRRGQTRRLRILLVVSIAVMVAAAFAVVLGRGKHPIASLPPANAIAHAGRRRLVAARRPRLVPAPLGQAAARRVAVPILMYHVIARAPFGAPFPGLYVSPTEFAAQMAALAHAGFRGVTLDQLQRGWHRGVLPRHPIVITFDNGYHTQYAVALPVLRRLGWPADENLQLSGLPPRQGGLSRLQVDALVRAGWELDTQGYSHADLRELDARQLKYEVSGARRAMRRLYGVKVDWFCYPSGRYDATVVAAVKAAGYTGSTTVISGWATPADDRYRLPRLRVLAGTSPSALLALIAGTRNAPAAPNAY